MTELEAINAIYGRWIAGWQTAPDGLHRRDSSGYPDVSLDPLYVPFGLKNEVFDKTDLGLLGSWARVSIEPTTAAQTTTGSAPSRKFQLRGNVFVQLFAPINQGDAPLAALVEDVRTVLQGKRLGGVNVYAGRRENLPEDGNWNACVVALPYRVVDTR